VSWELFVGLRYLRARRRVAFISLISLISLLGVTIGVATLNIVLAVMTGFEQDLRDKILGFNPHIVVVSYSGALAADQGLVEQVRGVPGVVAAAPFVYGQAMLTVGRSASGVVVRGIDPAAAGAVVDVERHLESGSFAALASPHRVTLPPEDGGTTVELPGVLIGAELARQLGVVSGSVVNLVSPLATSGPSGLVPRIKRFVLAGVFESGMYDYDTTLAYVALPDAQRFFDLRQGLSGIGSPTSTAPVRLPAGSKPRSAASPTGRATGWRSTATSSRRSSSRRWSTGSSSASSSWSRPSTSWRRSPWW